MGSGSSRIWTKRRRRTLTDLIWIAGWLLVAVFVLAMVPVLRNAGEMFTIDPIVSTSGD